MCRLNNTTNKSKQKHVRKRKGLKKQTRAQFFQTQQTHTHSKPKQAPPFWTDSVWFHPLTNTNTHIITKTKSSIYLSLTLLSWHFLARKRDNARAQTIPLITVEIHFINENKTKNTYTLSCYATSTIEKVNKHNYYDHNKVSHTYTHIHSCLRLKWSSLYEINKHRESKQCAQTDTTTRKDETSKR